MYGRQRELQAIAAAVLVELARRIQEVPLHRSLPIILLSSGGGLINENSVEFFAQLTKPVRASRLLNVISEAIIGTKVVTPTVQTRNLADANLGETNPLRILLAEDNVVNQKVALRMLERLGYRADVVSNGLKAVEAVKRGHYDVVLMDVEMPEMDGPEATRQLHAELASELVPKIITTTANALTSDRERLSLRVWMITSANPSASKTLKPSSATASL
jgi:CheY-like chemotaxis protein